MRLNNANIKKNTNMLMKASIIGAAMFGLMACNTTTATSPALSVAQHGHLKVATWNVEHLAYPSNTGCEPRTSAQISKMRDYANKVDADIFALQEVGSKQAVQQLFPASEWQIIMSTREDSEPFECRGSGNMSTQQKVAFAVKKAITINSTEGIAEFGLERRGLRYGLAVNVNTPLGDVSMLNVHMKSGCFVDNYSRSDRESCATFAKQAPILDGWIESHEKSGQPYMVMGDFNHRLTAPYNHLTQQLNTNSDGSKSTLVNTTAALIGCHPYYPAPIDLVFVGNLPHSNLNYDIQAHRYADMEPDNMLSDHCAVSLNITRQ